MKAGCYIFLLAIVFMTSCHKDETPADIDFGYSYFPLQEGSWKEYRLDSVIYSPFGSDSVQWICREVTDTILLNQAGQTEATIFVHKRRSDSVNWESGYTVTRLYRSSAQAEEWFNNTRYIRLVFPVYLGRTWNGNAMNSFENQEYKYEKVAYTDSIAGQFYQDLLKVVQQNRITLISQDTDEETFSRNLGLVEVRKTHLYNITSTKTGYTLTKTLIDSGNL
jgi:hypothetical protein